jgi:hypothetical protein
MGSDPYAPLRRAIDRFLKASGGSGPQRPPSAGRRIPPGMLGVTITDDSKAMAKGLDRIFDAFGATMDEIPDVLRAAVPTIREAHRATFRSEGAAGRGKWRPLAPSTLRDRQRLGYGPGPILVRSGQLRDHVLSAPAVVRRRGNEVELRIRPADSVGGVPKYVANAKGTSRIPGRPMVAVGPASAAKITSQISRDLRARARAKGLI